jgi:uncharacterized protein YcfJ
MKLKLTVGLLSILFAQAAYADNKSTANIRDVYIEVEKTRPITEKVCRIVEVPIYSKQQKQGGAAEGALLGMLLGGAIGKGVTGKNDGAAAGAVIGGLIGADKGAQGSDTIVGYRKENRCTNETTYENFSQTVYSHSEVTFKSDSKTYVLRFYKD